MEENVSLSTRLYVVLGNSWSGPIDCGIWSNHRPNQFIAPIMMQWFGQFLNLLSTLRQNMVSEILI